MTNTDRLAQALRLLSHECDMADPIGYGWKEARKAAHDALAEHDAALASLATAAVEGDACGVLLPCEPTKEILAAMTDGWSCGGDPRGEYHNRYRQMLSVASKAPRNCAKLRNELDRYISNTDAMRAPVNQMRETAKKIAEAGRVVKPINERAAQETLPPVGTKFKADAEYRLWKLQQCIPVMQEARDALCALTTAQIKLHHISPTLAERMDTAGTANVPQWQAAIAAGDGEGV